MNPTMDAALMKSSGALLFANDSDKGGALSTWMQY
jgi:hypothetical protein